nr:Pnap_2097 family protein [Sphingomonas sp. CDS-1]
MNATAPGLRNSTSQTAEFATSPAVYSPAIHSVRLGMPELSRVGLSENWLIKACGHRHWLALADIHGVEHPQFRNSEGARLYPAFTAVRLSDVRLEDVGENQLLEMHLTLCRTSRTCFQSEIEVIVEQRKVATVTMESAFIWRSVEGSNRSVRRGVVARPCQLLPPPPGQHPRKDVQRIAGPILRETILDPSPHEDLNGVGLLYCASFQAMLDRAEWQWFRQMDPLTATRSRTIQFLGNAELGDRIRAALYMHRTDGDTLAHMIELTRVCDGAPIGRAITQRALIPAMDLVRRLA